jgi:hypothetical protein
LLFDPFIADYDDTPGVGALPNPIAIPIVVANT